MQTLFDADGQQVDLVFDSPEELAANLAKLKQRGLLLIRLAEPPQPQQPVRIVLRHGDNEVVVESQVHQVFRSGATEHGVALKPTVEIPEPTPGPVEETPVDDQAQDEVAASGQATVQRTEMTGAAIALEIKRMNVSQRMRLATRAGRLERQILLRDNSPQVLTGLLANPRIDETEVRDLVRSPHAASGVLQQVAKDRRWSSNYEVRLSLVRNPKTPTPLAQRLLPSLRKSDLQTLAKSPNVREAIKGAALRLYLGKI